MFSCVIFVSSSYDDAQTLKPFKSSQLNKHVDYSPPLVCLDKDGQTLFSTSLRSRCWELEYAYEKVFTKGLIHLAEHAAFERSTPI